MFARVQAAQRGYSDREGAAGAPVLTTGARMVGA